MGRRLRQQYKSKVTSTEQHGAQKLGTQEISVLAT